MLVLGHAALTCLNVPPMCKIAISYDDPIQWEGSPLMQVFREGSQEGELNPFWPFPYCWLQRGHANRYSPWQKFFRLNWLLALQHCEVVDWLPGCVDISWRGESPAGCIDKSSRKAGGTHRPESQRKAKGKLKESYRKAKGKLKES